MSGKKYRAARAEVPTAPTNLEEAIALLKKHARTSFNETVELHVRLGIDASKSDQMVRGNVTLPSGPVKAKRIVVFAGSPSDQEAARAAGAAEVGGEELVERIMKEGRLEADVAVATPDMMPKIAKVARILGPQGLMPNPKTGTVTPKVAETVKEMAAGKASFKMDQLGNIHEAVGKADWEPERIIANVRAVIEAVRAARPAAAKGEIIKTVTLATTMSPGVRIVL